MPKMRPNTPNLDLDDMMKRLSPADKEKMSFGKGLRFWRQSGSVSQELLVYQITRAQIMKLVKSEKIFVQVGNYSGGISADSLTWINNLLNAS